MHFSDTAETSVQIVTIIKKLNGALAQANAPSHFKCALKILNVAALDRNL